MTPEERNLSMDASERILETDRQRIEAMVAAEPTDLECYFTEDLTYTHTNGSVDSKATLIDKIRNGAYDYTSIDSKEIVVKGIADRAAVLIGNAVLGVRTAAGKTIEVPIRFTSVYVRDGDDWKMTAWQSTRSE